MSESPDKYGRTWPDVPITERCPSCGQPDNSGECSHGKLSKAQVVLLGGRLAEGEREGSAS